MKTVIGDFHVHTLLSPCAEIEMTPHHIVMQVLNMVYSCWRLLTIMLRLMLWRRFRLVNVMVLRCSREWKLNAGRSAYSGFV